MENVISVSNLVKNGILNNISFDIKKGEMVAIMGPSGSGKSTLLYNVSGMNKADSGKVIISGHEITGMNEDEKAAFRLNNAGFVFQNMNMLSNLNIFDNIIYPAVNAKKANKNEINEYAKCLMEKMGISELALREIREVSGGQLQRACICRSMINKPEILFADEPTGALNQSSSKDVMDAFEAINNEGTTIMIVTHDSKVAKGCGRIIFVVDGKIAGDIKIDKALSEEERSSVVDNKLKELGW